MCFYQTACKLGTLVLTQPLRYLLINNNQLANGVVPYNGLHRVVQFYVVL